MTGILKVFTVCLATSVMAQNYALKAVDGSHLCGCLKGSLTNQASFQAFDTCITHAIPDCSDDVRAILTVTVASLRASGASTATTVGTAPYDYSHYMNLTAIEVDTANIGSGSFKVGTSHAFSASKTNTSIKNKVIFSFATKAVPATASGTLNITVTPTTGNAVNLSGVQGILTYDYDLNLSGSTRAPNSVSSALKIAPLAALLAAAFTH